MGNDQGLTGTIQSVYIVAFACTIDRLYVRQVCPGGTNGNAVVYTVRKNGVDTALSVSLATTPSTAVVGSDTTDVVTAAAGDVIDVQVTKAASLGVATNEISATFRIIAT